MYGFLKNSKVTLCTLQLKPKYFLWILIKTASVTSALETSEKETPRFNEILYTTTTTTMTTTTTIQSK
uniref:Uncharacterized protein n=1 Tax=Glossina pallidipes TaxID=7398 RepID=A0A1A9ZUQ0_GLOPL